MHRAQSLGLSDSSQGWKEPHHIPLAISGCLVPFGFRSFLPYKTVSAQKMEQCHWLLGLLHLNPHFGTTEIAQLWQCLPGVLEDLHSIPSTD